MIKNIATIDKLVIKSKVFKGLDYVFIFLLVLSLSLFCTTPNLKYSSIIFTLIGLTIVANPFSLIWRLFRQSEKLIIDKKGIQICETNEFINWEIIDSVNILEEIEGGLSRDVLQIRSNESVKTIRLAEYSYKRTSLQEAIKFYSDKDFGKFISIFDKSVSELNEKVKSIIGSDKNTLQIAKTISSNYRYRQPLTIGLTMFILIGTSVYLQVIIIFPYVFAIGFTFTALCVYLIGILEYKLLKQKEFVCELNDEQINAIKKEYLIGKGHYNKGLEENRIIGLIIFITGTVGIFILSYLISKNI